MKILTGTLLLGILALVPFNISASALANEVSPLTVRGSYQDAIYLAFELSKQAEDLSYSDPYFRTDNYDRYPRPRRPRRDSEELVYAARNLKQAADDLYYTLRFFERSGGRGDESQIFRNFRSVKRAYQRLSYVAPYWKINRITNTYERLERALYGYRDRW